MENAMQSLSRRSLVTSAAALPALAVPAVAVAPVEQDADLQRLGKELEALIVEWHAQRLIDARICAGWETACVQAGLPRLEQQWTLDQHDEWLEHAEKRQAIRGPFADYEDADTNERGESIAWNRIHGVMFPLIDDILSRQATTIAGLAVQARAITLNWSERWGNEYQSDDTLRIFMERVCAFAGVKPVPHDDAATEANRVYDSWRVGTAKT
jgi:hypothetical protein